MHLERITLFPDKYPTKDHYPFNQAIFQTPTSIAFRKPVTFFVGENGTGKSTMLTAICKKCNVPIWQGPSGARYKPNPYEKVLYLFMAVKWTDGSVPGSFFSSATFKDFAKYLGKALNRPSVMPAPAFALRLLLGKERAEDLLLSGLRIVPEKLLEAGFRFKYPGIEDALGDIYA